MAFTASSSWRRRETHAQTDGRHDRADTTRQRLIDPSHATLESRLHYFETAREAGTALERIEGKLRWRARVHETGLLDTRG